MATDSLFSAGIGAGGALGVSGAPAQGGSDARAGDAGQPSSSGGSLETGGTSAGGATARGGAPASGGSSTAGGASNSGGQATGGSAGVAGAPSAPSVCDGKRVKAKALIEDFEMGVGNNWFGYIDKAQSPVIPATPGALESLQAARFLGANAKESGMGHGMSCTDVSAFDGISFWARTNHPAPGVRFLAAIPATDPTEGVGDCKPATMKCYDHPGKLFTFTGEWQRYSAAWSELKQYGWGTKAAFNNVINTVLWISDGPVDAFDFSIDEVVLYKGEPPTGHVGN